MTRNDALTTILIALSLASAPAGAEPCAPAKRLLLDGKAEEAIEAYRESAEVGQPECRAGLAAAYNQLGRYGDAEEEARAAIEAGPAGDVALEAHNQLGIALASPPKHRTKDLEQAAEAFRKVLHLSGGKVNAARFSLARVLLMLGRIEEGRALLEEFVARDPSGPFAREGRALAASPERVADSLAPVFTVTTLDGGRVSMEELKGKVVVLDFWATWCGPCKSAVPGLKKLAKRSGSEPVVVLGISADMNPDAVRQFSEKHDISWPQHVDPAGEWAARTFGVRSFPSYVVIDGDGFVIHRDSGWSPAQERRLASVVARAVAKAEREVVR